MASTINLASGLPTEIWDAICDYLNVPGSGSYPRHGGYGANWGGQRDLKSLRLVNRTACRSASRLTFRNVGQTHSGDGVRALSQLAESAYAPSVRALSMDLDNDLALNQSFESDLMPSAGQIGSLLSHFSRLNTVWVMKYPLAQGPTNRADWSGVRSERTKMLAFKWIEAIQKLGRSQLKQLNLVFSSVGQMKQFAAQLATMYPEGRTDSWFQACMIEEASGPLSKRAAHDVRCIFSIMPLDSANKDMQIVGSMGRDQEYRSYRLMQYIPAGHNLQSLHFSGVDLDGESLERVLHCNSQTLRSIKVYSSTLRTTSWAYIFETIVELCGQLEYLQVGCLGYLLPFSSILEKLSGEEREDRMAVDAGALSFLLQTVAGRRWEKGLRPVLPGLLCSACESTTRETQPTSAWKDAIAVIQSTKKTEYATMASNDQLRITNDAWKDMLWLHGRLWEG